MRLIFGLNNPHVFNRTLFFLLAILTFDTSQLPEEKLRQIYEIVSFTIFFFFLRLILISYQFINNACIIVNKCS